MRQLKYTKSDFGFGYHMVELLWVLNIQSLRLFSPEILPESHCANCATSGTWQGHYATDEYLLKITKDHNVSKFINIASFIKSF